MKTISKLCKVVIENGVIAKKDGKDNILVNYESMKNSGSTPDQKANSLKSYTKTGMLIAGVLSGRDVAILDKADKKAYDALKLTVQNVEKVGYLVEWSDDSTPDVMYSGFATMKQIIDKVAIWQKLTDTFSTCQPVTMTVTVTGRDTTKGKQAIPLIALSGGEENL